MALGWTNATQAQEDQTFTVNGVSFTMKYVEGGTFQMGAQNTNSKGQNFDKDAFKDESPVHSVTLSNYYIGETEVTQDLWVSLMESNPSKKKGNNFPVEQVSWNDVQEFVFKLNELTGLNFRLPTEAEWEYAARGGNKSKGYKYAGCNAIREDTDDNTVFWAVYEDNSLKLGERNSKNERNLGYGPQRVKSKRPNELGLYDMSGNVWEWCQDWFGNYDKGAQTDPTGPAKGQKRVFRGGSWGNGAAGCRVAFRNGYAPNNRSDFGGFRLVLTL